MRSGVRLAIVGLRSGLARRRDAAIEIDAGDGRWGEQGGRDEGGEATGLRECPSSPWCMQNDADHNVTRMNLGQAARQQSSTKRPAVQVAATCGVDLKPLATFIAPIRTDVLVLECVPLPGSRSRS